MMNFLINVSFFFMENFSVLEKRLSDPPQKYFTSLGFFVKKVQKGSGFLTLFHSFSVVNSE